MGFRASVIVNFTTSPLKKIEKGKKRRVRGQRKERISHKGRLRGQIRRFVKETGRKFKEGIAHKFLKCMEKSPKQFFKEAKSAASLKKNRRFADIKCVTRAPREPPSGNLCIFL